MLRDDDIARTARANALIDEIAGLERQQLAQATAARRLEDARCELATLGELRPAPEAPPPRAPGLAVHVAVFATAAVAAFLGYALCMS